MYSYTDDLVGERKRWRMRWINGVNLVASGGHFIM